MDTSGFSQVGRHGTLSLIKRNTAPTDYDVITSFGIDDDELTFGSSTTCGVRLYYPDVDALHCRLVFEEHKAFLVVLGATGASVDGCKVYPHTFGGKVSTAQQTIIPLSNNSEFEIHTKRFRFTYPPKEARKALYATPARPPKRALRLSLIHSAQVFSPRPSNDPKENLKTLQSPRRNPAWSPAKARNPSPLKAAYAAPAADDDDTEEEDIVLVHTAHPRVVEEEKDLVILENVPVSLLSPVKSSTPSRPPIQPPPQPPQPQMQMEQAPRTPPRRRSIGGNALHRAVLIRSAQRAVIKAEREREEEEEELEVLDAVVDSVASSEEEDAEGEDDGEDEDDGEEDEEDVDEDVEMRDRSDDRIVVDHDEDGEGQSNDEDADVTDEEDEEIQKKRDAAQKKPLWRKSLERILPWSLSGGDSSNQAAAAYVEKDDSDSDDETEEPAPLPVIPASNRHTPAQRNLGSFMTPQAQGQGVKRILFPSGQPQPTNAAGGPVPGRFSLGGEARRVIVEQPWKVRDLVVPGSAAPVAPAPSVGPPAHLRSADPPPSTGLGTFGFARRVPATPTTGNGAGVPSTPSMMMNGTPGRVRATPAVSEEERKAIQERRRSAVREAGFWGSSPSKVPGMGLPDIDMSPSKTSNNSSESGSNSAASSSSGGVPSTSSSSDSDSVGLGRESLSPVKRIPGLTPRFGSVSPTKGRPLGGPIAEEAYTPVSVASTTSSQEELDTQGLLERMKETVDNMKRRRSVVLGGAGSVLNTPVAGGARANAGPATGGVPATTSRVNFGSGISFNPATGIPKLDFTKLPPPGFKKTASASRQPSPAPILSSETSEIAPVSPEDGIVTDAEMSEVETEKEKETEEQPFSLLRPGALENRRQTLLAAQPLDSVQAEENAKEDAQAKVVPIVLPIVVVDPAEEDNEEEAEAMEEEPVKKTTRGRPKSKVGRPTRAKASVEESSDDAGKSKSKTTRTKAAPKSTRQRSRTPQPPVEEEPELAATKTTAAKRGRKVAAPAAELEVNEEEAEGDMEVDVEKALVKRGRKPRSAASGETEEVSEPKAKPAPAKRSRSKKGTSAEESVDEEPPVAPKKVGREKPPSKTAVAAATPAATAVKKPASASKPPSTAKPPSASKPPSTSKTRGTAKSKVTTPAPVAEEDGEDDPLDSYGDQEEEKAAPPARPPSRSTTTTATKAKTTAVAKKKVIKKEEDDASSSATTDEPAPLAATRGGRTARANADKTPAPKATTAAKTRGRPKTPATAPAATNAGGADASEKENTRSTGSESQEDSAAPVKLRVSRRAGGATTTATRKPSSKVKVEEDDEDDSVPPLPAAAATTGKAKTTRVMRTRART